jgi:hypothetical protein
MTAWIKNTLGKIQASENAWTKPDIACKMCVKVQTKCLEHTYLLTELSPSWEADNCAAIQEIPSNFKEPEGSPPCSQEPSTGPF